MTKRSMKLLGLMILVCSALAVANETSPAASATTRPDHIPGRNSRGVETFSVAGLHAGHYREAIRSLSEATRESLNRQLLSVRVLGDGEIAAVDASMVDGNSGLASAATPHSVRLAWTPNKTAGGYIITRDGKFRGRTKPGISSFEDEHVKPGDVHDYVVAPILSASTTGEHPIWGIRVAAPEQINGERPVDAAARSVSKTAAATVAASTTTLTWDAFIPQARIDAPSIGCDYGRGYQFGGDRRSFDWRSSRYRTALTSVITWNTRSVKGYTSVRPTHVYRKSTGVLVAQRTAYSGNLVAKKLGDGNGRVDIRMVNHASNPFCRFGAIDGAITFNIYQNGNWAIRSGTYRRMPNHEIYIYNGGRVTYLIKAPYQSVYCLIGPIACDSTNVTGYYGRYA